jgi:tRNA(fMet)-specific endonuclease VapC
MNRLLDTDTCIAVLRQRSAAVARISQFSPADCRVSTVTVYELMCGVEKTTDPARERQKVERFLAIIGQVQFDHAAAEAAAGVRADLERKGTPIGPYDTLIAGQALALDLILVTGNTGEFKRVPGLKLESWT